MVSKTRFSQIASAIVVTAALLFATAAFAGESTKDAKHDSENQVIDPAYQTSLNDIAGTAANGKRCAVAAPLPQGTQQIHVCNSCTGVAGSNVELFNTTGQSCTITTGSTTWPFVQSAPLSISNGGALWVTLLTTLTNGGTYDYSASCCPAEPTNPKIKVQ
jgi:hypothetical protein